ncbi:MAG: T9SS type A sorting domain-containing protein [Bacteroidetes bacterium]|nr:T9SS type A sorting domain-containing protein [Bacteroidota bacterium]
MKQRLLLITLLYVFQLSIHAQTTYTESFDGTGFVPGGWTDLLISGSNTWSRVTAGTSPTQATHSGAGEAMFNSFSANSGVRALVTPAIDYGARGAATATVSFWMYRENGYNTTADKIDVYVNTSVSLTGATLLGTVNRARGLAPTATSNGWFQYSYTIPATYTSNINYIIFKATSAYGNNIFIDDVSWNAFPPATDISCMTLVSPNGNFNCFGNNQTVSLQVKNTGTSTLNFSTNPMTVSSNVSMPVSIGSTASATASVTINSGTLAVNAVQTVVVTTSLSMTTNGTYTFNASATVSGDGNTYNNAMPATSIIVSKVNSFPHQTDFSVLPDPVFLVQQVSGTGSWSNVTTGNLSNPTLVPVMNSANGFAYFNSYSFSSGTVSNLVTPNYDMTTLSSPQLDLWVSQDNGWSGYNDKLDILVSTNGGTTWSSSLMTIARYNTAYSTPGWKLFTLSLAAYAGNPCVRIAIQGTSAYGNNIAIDYMKVYDLAGVLPVKLTDFKGEALSENENKLTWITASEENTKTFLLQRSEDGINFNTIHSEAAVGGVNGHTYHFTDILTEQTSVYYYRLTSIDYDNSSQSFKIIDIEHTTKTGSTASIFPNPSEGIAHIRYESASDETLTIIIMDMKGNTVLEKACDFTRGSNVVVLDLTKEQSGLYYIRLTDATDGSNKGLLKWLKN